MSSEGARIALRPSGGYLRQFSRFVFHTHCHIFLRWPLSQELWRFLCEFTFSIAVLRHLQVTRQGPNALNRSMQGLWNTHRRGKINLNAGSALELSASTSGEVPASEEATPLSTPPAERAANDGLTNPNMEPEKSPGEPRLSIVSGKRKARSSRTTGEESSKRARVVASSGAIAKDYSPPAVRLSDLGGVEACVEKMLELVAMPLCHPEIYIHTGVQPPRGVLLHGPPGCGKTLLAHAIAGVSQSR